MGYFSNSDEAMFYEALWCKRCVHYAHGNCVVLEAHFLRNYAECNKRDSILHMLIPRSANGLTNERCRLFFSNSGE